MANWSDDFESYTEDQDLCGVGGWSCSDGVGDSFTADTYAGSKRGHFYQDGDASNLFVLQTLSSKIAFPCNVELKVIFLGATSTGWMDAIEPHEDATNNIYVTIRGTYDGTAYKLQWFDGVAYQDIMTITMGTEYIIKLVCTDADTCELWVDGIKKVNNCVRSDRNSTQIGRLHSFVRKNVTHDMYWDDCSITSAIKAPLKWTPHAAL